MTNESIEAQRSTMLQMAAGTLSSASAAPMKPLATGKAGDFDFLSGEWKIKHRRLKGNEWDLFDGEATVVGILGGVASVEELRIPSRDFNGMGLRLLDGERRLWADYWVNGKNAILNPPPAWGSFTNGVGTWDAEEADGAKPIIVRGEWDQITPASCRWRQALSHDGGKTWAENWVMHWQRA